MLNSQFGRTQRVRRFQLLVLIRNAGPIDDGHFFRHRTNAQQFAGTVSRLQRSRRRSSSFLFQQQRQLRPQSALVTVDNRPSPQQRRRRSYWRGFHKRSLDNIGPGVDGVVDRSLSGGFLRFSSGRPSESGDGRIARFTHQRTPSSLLFTDAAGVPSDVVVGDNGVRSFKRGRNRSEAIASSNDGDDDDNDDRLWRRRNREKSFVVVVIIASDDHHHHRRRRFTHRG